MSERVWSLRARLVGTMAVLLIGGTVVLYAAARAYAEAAADRSYDNLLASSALSIAETLSVIGSEVHVDLPYASLAMLSSAPDDRIFYRVFGPGDQTVTGYKDLPVMRRLEPKHSDGTPRPRFFDADYRGERVRFVVLGRLVEEPGVSGWVRVQVGQTRRAREAFADELVLRASLPIALMTVLALSVAWFGIRGALRPLMRLSNELSIRQPSQLQPLTTALPMEIVPVADAINGFMKRLQINMDTLRGFIANAAHQMRTPLAALRAQAQVALDDEPAELRRSVVAIERNAVRLSRLLDQLLSDATVIHRSDVRRFDPIDLGNTVRAAMREAVQSARGADVSFESTLDTSPFTGDPLMLREAMKNLIDNSLRHGAGPVEVQLSRDSRDYVLTVADRGPGIPEEHLDRVFERFARGEGGLSGAGLGMAIVRQVVQGHGGVVSLRNRAGGGLDVRIVLPMSPA
jgi:two-component system sensor histidine kinase TctE